MTEPMEVTVTLDGDVVERLLEDPLWRSHRTPEEYLHHEKTGERFPLSLDEFVNDRIRRHPTRAAPGPRGGDVRGLRGADPGVR